VILFDGIIAIEGYENEAVAVLLRDAFYSG
jgi:hypothetical protein